MPAHCLKPTTHLTIELSRDGNETMRCSANGGYEALARALCLLSACRRLQAGDHLVVFESVEVDRNDAL